PVKRLVEVKLLARHLVAEVEEVGDLLIAAIALPRSRRHDEATARVCLDDRRHLADLLGVGHGSAAELTDEVLHTAPFATAVRSPFVGWASPPAPSPSRADGEGEPGVRT